MQTGNKKIDVDELKQKIVDGVKKSVNQTGKYSNQNASNSMISNANASRENNSKLMNRSTRSKSPGNTLGNNNFGSSLDDVPERGSAVKMDLSSGSQVADPAWYRALKRNQK